MPHSENQRNSVRPVSQDARRSGVPTAQPVNVPPAISQMKIERALYKGLNHYIVVGDEDKAVIEVHGLALIDPENPRFTDAIRRRKEFRDLILYRVHQGSNDYRSVSLVQKRFIDALRNRDLDTLGDLRNWKFFEQPQANQLSEEQERIQDSERRLNDIPEFVEQLEANQLSETQDHIHYLERRLDDIQMQLSKVLALLTASSVTDVPDHERLDVRAAMLQAEGGSYSAQDIAERIGVSRQTIYNWHRKGDITGASYRDRQLKFPVWQFESNGLLAGLSEVLHILAAGGAWTQIAFMLNPNQRLDGMRPLDLLRRGEVQQVVGAAELYGEHAPI